MSRSVAAVSFDRAHRLLPSAKAATPVTRGLGFQDLVASLRQMPVRAQAKDLSLHTIRSGETLSGICDTALRQKGKTPSAQQISDVVKRVARANGLADANVIRAGQTLDLSSLSLPSTKGAPAIGPVGRGSDAAVNGAVSSKVSEELTRLMQALSPAPAASKQAAAPTPDAWKSILDQPAQVSSGFGYRDDPITHSREYHAGVDLAAEPNTGIYAVRPGKVTFSGWQGAYGKTVIVQHDDGTETLYAHNAKNLVKAGQEVDGHTKIAQVGSTGRSTGPHVHFEVRQNGQAVNPVPFLDRASFQVAKAL